MTANRDALVSFKEAVFFLAFGFAISYFVCAASPSKLLPGRDSFSSAADIGNPASVPKDETRVTSRKPRVIKGKMSLIGQGKECRGVWIDRTTLPTNRKECTALIDRMVSMGINAIFPEVFSRTTAVCFNSKVAPWDHGFNKGNDLLAILIDEAHKKNVEVHGWVWCMCAGTAWRPGQKVINNSHWLAINLEGKMVSESGSFWLCPHSAGGNKYLLDVFSELVSNYDIDGINLDYIRVEENEKNPFCMCSRCRRNWFSWVDRDQKAKWPPTPRSSDYLRWREGLLDAFMERVARRIRYLDRNVALSACVLPLETRAKRLEGQHWGAWFTEGYLDFACALTYTDRIYRKKKWNKLIAKYNDSGMRILPSIGLHLCKENPHRGSALLKECLNSKLGGVMLFSLRDMTDAVELTLKDTKPDQGLLVGSP